MNSMLEDLAALRAVALTVHCIGQKAPGEDGPSLALHVDAAGRPDVEDLPRAIASEDVGPVMVDTGWGWGSWADGSDTDILINLNVQRPVCCNFTVLVSVRRHGWALQQIATEGYVGLTTACPDRPDLPMYGMVLPSSARAMILSVVAGAASGHHERA